jgi:hypothetical protein
LEICGRLTAIGPASDSAKLGDQELESGENFHRISWQGGKKEPILSARKIAKGNLSP